MSKGLRSFPEGGQVAVAQQRLGGKGLGGKVTLLEAVQRIQLMSSDEFEAFYRSCPAHIQKLTDETTRAQKLDDKARRNQEKYDWRRTWQQTLAALLVAANFLRSQEEEK